jgi:hypothetical protein
MDVKNERINLSSPNTILDRHDLQRQFDHTEKAEFASGKVEYSDIGAKASYRNTLMYIPGFAGSMTGVRGLAIELSNQGQDQVITIGQPKAKPLRGTDILDLHAEAVLAVVEQEGMTDQPLDVVVHSFGMMILERAAQKARDKGYTCFDTEAGAHSYAIAPAGLVEDETYKQLVGRWIGFMKDDSAFAKKYDADKEIANANAASVKKHLLKTFKEVRALKNTQIDQGKLGSIGLKPFIVILPGDKMFPYQGDRGEIGPVIEAGLSLDDEQHSIFSGAASPITPKTPLAIDFETFRKREKFDDDEKAKAAWLNQEVDSNSNSGHGDVSYHPQRIAGAIKQIRTLQYKQQ